MHRYQEQRKIGSGSFGTAILAVHRASGEQVVIKKIPLAGLPEEARKAARREAAILSHLKHPAIIRHIESFEQHDIDMLCIVTEFADRGDLNVHLERRKGALLREEVILDWFVQVCLALLYMHKRKILHRDLKLANIFLAADNQIRIGDFGIARALKYTAECAKTVVGTPYFLSPEICENRPYNHKSDVWAAGCVLYELCAQKHAFEASSITGLVRKILKCQVDPLPTAYSADLRGLVDAMLQLRPGHRPAIAHILAAPFLQPAVRAYVARCARGGQAVPYLELIPRAPSVEAALAVGDGAAATSQTAATVVPGAVAGCGAVAGSIMPLRAAAAAGHGAAAGPFFLPAGAAGGQPVVRILGAAAKAPAVGVPATSSSTSGSSAPAAPVAPAPAAILVGRSPVIAAAACDGVPPRQPASSGTGSASSGTGSAPAAASVAPVIAVAPHSSRPLLRPAAAQAPSSSAPIAPLVYAAGLHRQRGADAKEAGPGCAYEYKLQDDEPPPEAAASDLVAPRPQSLLQALRQKALIPQPGSEVGSLARALPQVTAVVSSSEVVAAAKFKSSVLRDPNFVAPVLLPPPAPGGHIVAAALTPTPTAPGSGNSSGSAPATTATHLMDASPELRMLPPGSQRHGAVPLGLNAFPVATAPAVPASGAPVAPAANAHKRVLTVANSHQLRPAASAAKRPGILDLVPAAATGVAGEDDNERLCAEADRLVPHGMGLDGVVKLSASFVAARRCGPGPGGPAGEPVGAASDPEAAGASGGADSAGQQPKQSSVKAALQETLGLRPRIVACGGGGGAAPGATTPSPPQGKFVDRFGATLALGTAIAPRDPAAFRVEALRTFLGELLGTARFVALYRQIVAARATAAAAGSPQPSLSGAIRATLCENEAARGGAAASPTSAELVPLFFQLLHCEARAFSG